MIDRDRWVEVGAETEFRAGERLCQLPSALQYAALALALPKYGVPSIGTAQPLRLLGRQIQENAFLGTGAAHRYFTSN